MQALALQTTALRYTRRIMRRPAVLIALVFAMLWQSLALAHGGLRGSALGDLAHAALHWQGLSHHHLDDGSLQLDDSTESERHLATDHVCVSLAMAAPAAHQFPTLPSTAPRAAREAPAPTPTLDGPLRPPRLHT